MLRCLEIQVGVCSCIVKVAEMCSWVCGLVLNLVRCVIGEVRCVLFIVVCSVEVGEVCQCVVV